MHEPNETSGHAPNARGKYYVIQEYCAYHSCCVDIAPDNFTVDGANEARVYKQPETAEEEKSCREALECGPMGAIFDDGDLGANARHHD